MIEIPTEKSVVALLNLFTECREWNTAQNKKILDKAVTEPNDVFCSANLRESSLHLMQCESLIMKASSTLSLELLTLVDYHFKCQARFIEWIFNLAEGQVYEASLVFHCHMTILRNHFK